MRTSHSLNRRKNRRLQVILALPLLAVLASQPVVAETVHDRPSQAPTISLAEPPGFAALTGDQQAVVDLVFGGQQIGAVRVTYRPGSLTIADPGAVAALLGGLTDPAQIRSALSDPQLASNASLVCTAGADPATCGRLDPEIAGVIFDENRFQLEVFVNPSLLAARSATERRYLAPAEPGVALVNAIGLAMSGGGGDQRYNLQNRLVIGDAARRFRADLAYATDYGLQADQLAVEIDRPDWRFTAGMFWTPGTELTGRQKLIGAGLASQVDTRLDKDQLRGTPLVVFLNQRARVDLVRDGRLLSSRIYQAGNQTLDTAMLPDGSYELEIRIEEAGGATMRERRFFSRNALLPAVGEHVLFGYAGFLADDSRPGLINPTDSAFVQIGAAKRFGPHLAIDGSAMLIGQTGVVQLGGYYVARSFQLRLAALALTDGRYGGLLRLASNSNGRLNFDFDLRHIRAGAGAQPLGTGAAATGPSAFVSQNLGALTLAEGSFTQINGSASYSANGMRLSLAGSWRQSSGRERDYTIGPTAQVDLVRRGPLRLVANADLTQSNRGRAGYVGLGLQLLGQRGQASSNVGYRSTDLDGSGHRRSGAVASVQGSWQSGSPDGTELELGGGYDRALENELLSARAVLDTRTFEARGELIHNLDGQSHPTQYSLGLATTVALRGGQLAFDSQQQSDSLVLIDLAEAGATMQFEVLVNESVVGKLNGGGHLPLALTPYHEYTVRIRQIGGDLARYDGASRRVALYPGNVVRLDWNASPLVAVFGRLVDTAGQALANVALDSNGSIGQTDDSGYFDIQTASGAMLVARLPDGSACNITMPELSGTRGYSRAGTLTCDRSAAALGSNPPTPNVSQLKRAP